MKYTISISVDPEHLELIDGELYKGESRSKFLVKSAIKEAIQRKKQKDKVKK